jgi:hypothetical protein
MKTGTMHLDFCRTGHYVTEGKGKSIGNSPGP